jgi:hypothetical protein
MEHNTTQQVRNNKTINPNKQQRIKFSKVTQNLLEYCKNKILINKILFSNAFRRFIHPLAGIPDYPAGIPDYPFNFLLAGRAGFSTLFDKKIRDSRSESPNSTTGKV